MKTTRVSTKEISNAAVIAGFSRPYDTGTHILNNAALGGWKNGAIKLVKKTGNWDVMLNDVTVGGQGRESLVQHLRYNIKK